MAHPSSVKQAMKNQSLRDKMMREHAEVDRGFETRAHDGQAWGIRRDRSARLLRRAHHLHLERVPDREEFREELTPEYFRRLLRAREGNRCARLRESPIYPCPSFAKRDRARRRLVEMLTEVFESGAAPTRMRRRSSSTSCSTIRTRRESPATRSIRSPGMFISMMFAGHHTTSGTAAWTLDRAAEAPDVLTDVVVELDEIYADGRRRQLPGPARDSERSRAPSRRRSAFIRPSSC